MQKCDGFDESVELVCQVLRTSMVEELAMEDILDCPYRPEFLNERTFVISLLQARYLDQQAG